ncbi:MAG: hypothetical protein HC858_11885 [Brachymonas sp.]|nr:hypothetical protein [Brachymonas sp.]
MRRIRCIAGRRCEWKKDSARIIMIAPTFGYPQGRTIRAQALQKKRW